MIASRVLPRSLGSTSLGRIYALVRCLVLLFITAAAVASGALDPLFRWTLLASAVYAVITGGMALLPAAQRVLPWLYATDLLVIVGVGWTGQGPASTYAPWLLVPLMVAAFHMRRPTILALSTVAIVGASVLMFKQGSAPDLFSFIMQAAIYAMLPLLFHVLADQRSQQAREEIVKAEQQVKEVAAHAEGTRDRMHALYQAVVSLHTVEHATNILETTLTECARVLPYTSGVVVLSTGMLDEVAVVASRNVQPQETTQRFKVGTGILGVVLRGGPGGVVSRPGDEPELTCLPSLRAHPTVLLVPLRANGKTFGLVLFGSDEPQFSLEQMEMVTLLVGYGLIALQNVRLIADLKTERESLLAREEEVRKQLNRDLHDGPAQALAAITMTVDHIKRLHELEPERVVPELDALKDRAQRANHEVRTLLFELRPLVLETQGLITALEQYVQRFENQPKPRIVLRADTSVPPLTKRTQSALFGVVQEAVNNALKHAHADTIWIRLSEQAREVTLVIQDDGRGFDLQAVQASYDERGSFGLLSLNERTALVGGSTEITSAPGQGTTVRVKVPVS